MMTFMRGKSTIKSLSRYGNTGRMRGQVMWQERNASGAHDAKLNSYMPTVIIQQTGGISCCFWHLTLTFLDISLD